MWEFRRSFTPPRSDRNGWTRTRTTGSRERIAPMPIRLPSRRPRSASVPIQDGGQPSNWTPLTRSAPAHLEGIRRWDGGAWGDLPEGTNDGAGGRCVRICLARRLTPSPREGCEKFWHPFQGAFPLTSHLLSPALLHRMEERERASLNKSGSQGGVTHTLRNRRSLGLVSFLHSTSPNNLVPSSLRTWKARVFSG